MVTCVGRHSCGDRYVANRLATLACAYARCDLAKITATTTANTTTSGSSSGSSSGGSDGNVLGSMQLRCVLVPPAASTLSAAASPTRRLAEPAVVVDGANAQARDLWLCVLVVDSVAFQLAGSTRGSNSTVFVFRLLVSERPCVSFPRVESNATHTRRPCGRLARVLSSFPLGAYFQPTPCLPLYFMNE